MTTEEDSMPTAHLTPKSVLRHRPIAPTAETIAFTHPRASRNREQGKSHTVGGMPSRSGTRSSAGSWFLAVGTSMVVFVLLAWLVQGAWSWGSALADDLRYGRPRTTHVQAFVGHEKGTSVSQFVAVNIDGQARVIEFPGGDSSHAMLYLGPHMSGPESELAPVQLLFVNGSDAKHPDMIIQMNGVGVRYKNVHGRFATPGTSS